MKGHTMASPNSTPPLFLHLHEYALETATAMRLLERRAVAVTGTRPALRRAEKETANAAA
jgi:hypothetical protein